jgi:hypothetical protein
MEELENMYRAKHMWTTVAICIMSLELSASSLPYLGGVLYILRTKGLIDELTEVLVDPKHANVLEKRDDVEDRHSRCIYHSDEEECHDLRIPDLQQKVRSHVHSFIVLLHYLLRLSKVLGTTPVNKPLKVVGYDANHSANVRCEDVDEHSKGESGAYVLVPLDAEVVESTGEDGEEGRKLHRAYLCVY